MGAFYLARRSADGGATGAATARAALQQQGFSHIVDLSNQGFDILYCRKLSVDGDSLYRRDPDNFCLSTGTLIYRGRSGADAAQAVFEDFSGGALDMDQVHGNFALAICVAGVIHLHNDPQGVYNLWHDRETARFSSSFPAMVACEPRLTLNRDAVYPYVFQEATFGGDTVFEQIERLRVGSGFRLAGGTERVAGLAQPLAAEASDNMADNVAALHRRLGAQFAAITGCFGEDIDSALSGGYDSRLLLALCREQGITPHLHVYGSADSADVRVAQAVCRGEGIALSHEDKSRRESVTPQQFAQIVERNHHAFQAICADGILDNGADLHTRRSRTAGGRLQLNGGGGEVMRNFFYLPDRRYRSRELLWSFYSRFDPAVCTDAFSAEAYYAHFEAQIAQLTGSTGTLDRQTVEYLYAGFRCTYWMGQNNAINNQFGWFLTPFVEYPVAQFAHAVPLRHKNHGRLQAALIADVSPSLAAYPSDYGHDFSGEVPLKRRLKDMATLLRPTWLRRYAYRLHKFSRDDWPYYLGEAYIREILPEGFPWMSQFFHIDKVVDAAQFKRICTLEYLLRKCGGRVE